MAIDLIKRNQCHNFIIVEKSSSFGGTWHDSTNRWTVDVKVLGGKDAEFSPAYTIECDFLVSAVGQLNQPRYPEIEGLGDFKGKIMHSARWDWSYSLQEKSVGVIGNGIYCCVFHG